MLQAKAALKAGKSLPPLKKLKMLSEIGVAGLPEEILAFTDHDLLRMQCFFLKLELRFNDHMNCQCYVLEARPLVGR